MLGKLKIKAVVMHHDSPANADNLYAQLSPVFDDVEIFDSESSSGLVPIHTSRSLNNVYWTGMWNEILATCSGYDAVWGIGGDIELVSSPIKYRNAIEDSLPFGCWSPCIRGRSEPFMREVNYSGSRSFEVLNVEGMAMAVSGDLMRVMGKLHSGSSIGYGQDCWMCHKSRENGMRNIIDGRVVVFHPEKAGYRVDEAVAQMEEAFGSEFGPDFRKTVFKYDSGFEGNLVMEREAPEKVKPFTIVTVDNGWGLTEFIRTAEKIRGSRRIVMQKGVSGLGYAPGFEFVPYDESLSLLIKEADVAFFPRVGASNKDDYFRILSEGIPIVVRESCSQGVIEHTKNGWLFKDDTWAQHWLAYLFDNRHEIERIRSQLSRPSFLKPPMPREACKVTVITPTYKRDPDVIRRCIGSLLLQTEKNWEQIVCSDGMEEAHVSNLVASIGDGRVRYRNTTEKKDGDHGHLVRSKMLNEAKGKYVMFLDDDNVILPNYIDEMVSRLESAPDCDFAVCRIMHFGPLNEAEVGKPPAVLTGNPVKLYHIDTLQVLVRREIMQRIGWDTSHGYLSDGITLEKLGSAHKAVWVDQVLGIHM